jgi:hypothetical protein
MEISFFLAKFWGWFFVTFFFLLIIYPRRIKQMFEFAKDDKFMIILSVLAIIIGLLNIVAHNLWVKDWRLIITLFGYFSLIKGVSQFAFPRFAWDWMEKVDFKWFQFLLLLMLIMAIILLNQAYQWVPF